MSRLISSTADASSATASIDIEAIVRRVLRQLRAERLERPENNSESASSSTFALENRVVSLDDLKSIAGTVKTLQVSARAVITPAARDELRQRGIELSRTGPTVASAAAAKNSVHAGSRAIHLQRDGDVSDNLFASVKKQIASRGVRLCSKATLNVLLSSRPATTAHQQSGPQRCVVSINRVDDVPRFMAELSPNVFVLDVQHLHLVALAGAIATIARPGVTATPNRPNVTVAGGLS